SLKDDRAFELIRGLHPDLIVVMAYGIILPNRVLEIPGYGCINAHASLLPKYRGAAPVQYAVMNGDRKTGVTVIFMNEEVDAGDILSVREIEISDTDDAESVFKKISNLSALMLPAAAAVIGEGKAAPVRQDDSAATFAPRIKKEMGLFSFKEQARVINDRVRGLCVWPVAFFKTGGRTVKVLKSECLAATGAPGEVLSLKPLTVAAINGAVALHVVAPAGGRRMDGSVFASGLRLKKGDIL
ncbi:MAG: methionyl-tRNA formyltransferase, partial [Oscillospiraceae bacterium]|nr:methionyl-tRNA formyltransferase [Oscillospiraceae bacterium]